MSTLGNFLHEVAQKCLAWSRSTYDLGTAQNLRELAGTMEEKARECEDVDCPDKRNLSN
jgi:hypothetical protein